MAESFIVRRGGSGGADELNIWTGSQPPGDEVGVWVDSSIQNPKKYIVPYGSMNTDGVWTIDSATMPIGQVYKFNPVMYNGLIYIFFTDESIYSFEPSSSVFTKITGINIASPYCNANYFWYASAIVGSVAHLIGYSGSYTTMYDAKVDLESKVVSYATRSDFSDDLLIPVASSINGNVFFFSTQYDSRDAAARAFRIDDTSITLTTSLAMQTGSAYSIRGAGASFGEYMYIAAVKDYSTKLIYGTYRYNMLTNVINKVATYPSYNPASVAFASQDNFYCINGTTMYTMDLTSFVYTSTQNAIPMAVNNNSYTVGIDTGTEYIIFGCGGAYNGIIRNSRVKTEFEYPSVIIENGSETNQAEIISGNNGTSIINVNKVYENISGTPSIVDGQVRITGGEWTTIE